MAGPAEPSYYAQPGPLTQLSSHQVELVRHLGTDPERLCRYAQAVLTPVGDAYGSGLSPARMTERNTRPATALLQRALELDPSPLSVPRRPEDRVVGTCRHFAVLATAYLRAVAIPARARCGFASYFVPGRFVDHWIVEYWAADAKRWVAIRDLASLHKVEMLPWDAWEPMEAFYKCETAPEFDQLIDEVAAACRDAGPAATHAVYARVAVPAETTC